MSDNDCVGEIGAATILKMLALAIAAVLCVAGFLLTSGCSTNIPQEAKPTDQRTGESDAAYVARTQADAARYVADKAAESAEKIAKITADTKVEGWKSVEATAKYGALSKAADCHTSDTSCVFAKMTVANAISTMSFADVIKQQVPAPTPVQSVVFRQPEVPQFVREAPKTLLQQVGDTALALLDRAVPVASLVLNYKTGIVQSNNAKDTALANANRDVLINGQNTGAFTAISSQNHGSSVINNITNGSGAVNTGGGSANSSNITNSYNPTTGSYNPTTGGLKYCWPATSSASGIPGYPAGCVQ